MWVDVVVGVDASRSCGPPQPPDQIVDTQTAAKDTFVYAIGFGPIPKQPRKTHIGVARLGILVDPAIIQQWTSATATTSRDWVWTNNHSAMDVVLNDPARSDDIFIKRRFVERRFLSLSSGRRCLVIADRLLGLINCNYPVVK
eukprot:CAMPEP_0201124440 /NCGR_PEP_ID=MMETSP0850-20130426/13401_1 /ASSEMBLY_ACC=CAM_ASM_000622 /TAXON_ID=183588 /ORGANISM="Pseudo-nitzschia fraudulenta, Strain WWA7" /LENGTH=142 /DNA_ID=CAMNT_0047391823 /DNA_START=111 /DNA_END=537 /DNA_ORIENTATION=-